jgi:hypothetical protein
LAAVRFTAAEDLAVAARFKAAAGLALAREDGERVSMTVSGSGI